MTDQRDDMDQRDEAREAHLPEHEIDDVRSVGGGMMSSGGTAVDRGTGTLADGPAGSEEGTRGEPFDEAARDRERSGNTDVTNAGRWEDDTDPLSSPDDEPEEAQPNPYFRA